MSTQAASIARETDVLVVGAGPTGLTLGFQLARLGVRVRVVDRSAAPSTTSKAIGLQYRVSEVLCWMGLFDRFLAQSAENQAVNLYVDGRRSVVLQLRARPDAAGAGAFVPRPLILPQSETEALLIEALRQQGHEVERSRTFVGFEETGDRIVSRVTDAAGVEHPIASRYLVSCEGAHSVIRKLAGISFAGKAYPHDFVMADVDLDWDLDGGVAHSWMHPDGVLSAIPLPGQTWRLFIEMRAGADPTEAVTLEQVERLLAARTGDTRARAGNPTWLTRFKLHSRMVDRFRRGRVFLAGDAAHLHSPSGGQGITTGMQDAYNLAWKLGAVIRGGAPESLLDTYEEERLPIARQVLAGTDSNTRILFARGRLGKLFRDRVFLPLLRTEVVQDRLVRRLSQLEMSYRGARLSQHHERDGLWPRSRLRAGDRAPDVVLARAATGARTTLFELLQGSRWVALLGAPAFESGFIVARALQRLGVMTSWVRPRGDGAPAADEDLLDVRGDFQRIYGAEARSIHLVRPDGYAGLVERPLDVRRVQTYLAQVFAPGDVERAFRAADVPTPAVYPAAIHR